MASTQFVILVLPSDLPRSCPPLLLVLPFSLAAWEGPAITLLPLFTTRSKTHERASACRASEFFAFYRFIIKAGPLHRLPISGDRDATLATQSNHAVLLECTNLFSDPLSPSDRVQRREVLSLSPPPSLSLPFLLFLIVRLESAWYRRGSRFCHFSTNPSRFRQNIPRYTTRVLDFNVCIRTCCFCKLQLWRGIKENLSLQRSINV